MTEKVIIFLIDSVICSFYYNFFFYNFRSIWHYITQEIRNDAYFIA